MKKARWWNSEPERKEVDMSTATVAENEADVNRDVMTLRPLSSDDYDDIAGHLSSLARIDARAIAFNSGVAFRSLAFKAIEQAIWMETVARKAYSKTLPVQSASDLSPQDIERLAWKYLAALSMAKESEVGS